MGLDKKPLFRSSIFNTQKRGLTLKFKNLLTLTLNNLKTKLPKPFTSKVLLFCRAHCLFKDPAFLSDYFLLMVEFCNRFLGQAQMAAAGGNPWWFWRWKTLRGSLRCSDVGQRLPQGSDSFLACDWLPKPVASCLGHLCPAKEEMRRRRWLRHRNLVLVSAALWIFSPEWETMPLT